MILKKFATNFNIINTKFLKNLRLIKYRFNFKFNIRLPLILRFCLLSVNFLIINRLDESSREDFSLSNKFYDSF